MLQRGKGGLEEKKWRMQVGEEERREIREGSVARVVRALEEERVWGVELERGG